MTARVSSLRACVRLLYSSGRPPAARSHPASTPPPAQRTAAAPTRLALTPRGWHRHGAACPSTPTKSRSFEKGGCEQTRVWEPLTHFTNCQQNTCARLTLGKENHRSTNSICVKLLLKPLWHFLQ